MSQQQLTRVANVRTMAAFPDDGSHVYVGRPMRRHRFACVRAGSPLGNPFRVGPDGTIAQVLEKYAEHVRSRPDLVALLPSLRGKTLVCWCCFWSGSGEPDGAYCHAMVLAVMADESSATPLPA